MGMGRKTRNMYNTKNKENSCLVALPSPVYENGGRLFPESENTDKQARPTRGGTGILL